MTAVVGLRCSDGFVICADQQMSSPDYYKYYECKILTSLGGPKCRVFMAYAGNPGSAKESRDKIDNGLEACGLDRDFVTCERARQVIDGVLTEMGRQQADIGFQMIVAICGSDANEWGPQILVFDGKGLHAADRFTCLGVGDSSLIRYLSGNVFATPAEPQLRFPIDVALGCRFGIYMIEKAKQYIDHVGGKTDVLIITEEGEHLSVSEEDIEGVAADTAEHEAKYLQMIVDYSKR